jgi:ATP-dependent DNA ligase
LSVLIRRPCKLGLKGIVAKRLSARYGSGPLRDWIKVKNPNNPQRCDIARSAGNAPTSRLWLESNRERSAR